MGNDSITVLVSGGLDSMACVHFYSERYGNVNGLFIDYDQKPMKNEKKSALRTMEKLAIPLSILHIKNLRPLEKESGFIQGRNMAFLILGLMNVQSVSGAIALGIHSGTEYVDCSSEFISLSQKVFDLYTAGKFTVGSPFIEWTKEDIWHYCIQNKLPVELTYSCEAGLSSPCGKCKSCKDREYLNAI